MALTKVTYTDLVTIIGAQNLNDIQDAIIALEEWQSEAGADIPQILADIAPRFSNSTSYSAGDCVIVLNKLYQFTADHPAGNWTGTDATEVNVTSLLKEAVASLSGEVDDLKSAIDDFALKYTSSTNTKATAIASGKRWLLNVDNPIASDMLLGHLWLYANSLDTTLDVEIELANKNDNGTYTAYDSVTKSLAIATRPNDKVDVGFINKVTDGDTYVFITCSANTKFTAAGVTGKKMVLSDDTANATFTVREVANYEINYELICSASLSYYSVTASDINDLQHAVGDYDYYHFYVASVTSGSFWNNYFKKTLPLGTQVKLTLKNYVGASTSKFGVFAYDSDNNYQNLGAFNGVGSCVTGVLDRNVVQFRVFAQANATVTDGVIDVTLEADDKTGLTQDVMHSKVSRIYRVEKDGSGDFTNLATALEVACSHMDSIVYVGAGTWNILDELGAEYLANMSTTKQGIVLKNRVHVICSTKAYIKCLYSGSDANVINYLSAFNAGPYGFTLENADIEVANVRYCVHDERNAEADHYDNTYINCRMKNTNQTAGSHAQCIGGGLGYDGHIVIDGCTFENPLRENYGVVSYHNAHGAATDSRSLIEVKGCYFYGKNTFRAGYYGNTTAITQCLVHGNSMGAEPYMTQEDASFTNVNMEIIAWNNEIRTN